MALKSGQSNSDIAIALGLSDRRISEFNNTGSKIVVKSDVTFIRAVFKIIFSSGFQFDFEVFYKGLDNSRLTYES